MTSAQSQTPNGVRNRLQLNRLNGNAKNATPNTCEAIYSNLLPKRDKNGHF